MKTLRSSLIVLTLLTASLCAGVRSAYADAIIRAPNNLGLVGYWSFDEGRGTQSGDLSGNGNNGTFNGNPEWVVGKFKGALEFDGVSNMLPTSLIHTDLGDNITVSSWVFADATSGTLVKGGTLGGDGANSGFYLRIINGQAQFNIGNGVGNRVTIAGGPQLSGGWNHVVGTLDGAELKLYVNGSLVDSTNYSGYSYGGGQSVTFGARGIAGTGIMLDGKMDEVRIYNRALSETEVQSLYNSTSSTLVGSTPTEQYSDGLVAHYTFDGKHMTAATAIDAAGDNDGTLVGGTMLTPGVIGQAMKFGIPSSGRVELGNSEPLNISGDISISAWFKKDACVNGGIVGKWVSGQTGPSSYLLTAYSGCKIAMFISDGSQTSNNGYGAADPYPLNQWNHVVGVYDTADQTITVYLNGSVHASASHTLSGLNITSTEIDVGSWGGSHGNGTNFLGDIDDVRIYNKALSSEEVHGLYTATKPSSMTSSTDSLVTNGLVGHWTFDSQTIDGTTVADVSGNGNDGVMVGNTTPSSGIMGGALLFDGSGDYVTIPNSPSLNPGADMTMAMWVSWGGKSGENNMLTKEDAYEVRVSGGTVNYATNPWAWRGGSSPQIAQDAWHHVAVTNDADGLQKIYIDGVEKFSTSSGGSIASNSSVVTIGRRMNGSSYFEGMLDDVRIYNRVLTESEVEQLYSMGQ